MHIMLDLETLSTKNNALILSIGAVKFNGAGLHESFFERIKIEDLEGFDVSAVTAAWWLGQDKPAQQALLSLPQLDIDHVLHNFSMFVMNKDTSGGLKLVGMWGNGATFDNVILRNAYEVRKIKCPWHYRYDRCYRSLKYVLPEAEFIRLGVHHNPLDDAKSQAIHLIKLCNQAGIDLGE